MPRKPPVGKSLAEVNPALAKEWHPTKNADLTPFDFTAGSNEKVWWKCDKGIDHEWDGSINNRSRGRGCPICSGRMLVASNTLAIVNPELAKEWHPTKNGKLTSFDVFPAEGRKVWWKCSKGEDHEWEASPNNRSKGQGCAVCSNKKVVNSNCLATTHPDLAKEWHPSRNKDKTPFDIIAGTNKKFWWKCPKGDDHEWEAPGMNRVKGIGCPICAGKKAVPSNCLMTTHPELAKEWHHKLNDKTPNDYTFGSGKTVTWICSINPKHVWKSTISNRVNGNGCPYCVNKKVNETNCLATTHPELAKEWHPTLNKKLTPYNIHAGSSKMAYWICSKNSNHIWKTRIESRKYGGGCSICAGKIIDETNCLATTHPHIVDMLCTVNNEVGVAYNYSYGSNKKLFWKCDKGDDHIWQKSISEIVKGKGCPICSGHKIVLSNCLATTHPEIAKEWHPTLNKGKTPYQTTKGRTNDFWWKCPEGDDHIWKASPNDRTSSEGKCPICEGKIVVPSISLQTLFPKIAEEWHPTENIGTPDDYTAHSSKMATWKCNKGRDHVWSTSISKRTDSKKPTGCPFCTLTPQSKEELTITFELITIFEGIDPKGFKKRIDGKLYSIDIYIPKIHIGIEFDGSYWHKDNQVKDKQKTLNIKQSGLNLIRVRQRPLERLFENDVMAEEKFDGKQITNDILKQIVKDNGKYSYTLDKRTLNKIDNYLSREGLQNENGLDKYIDQILTEKAERKK